ncbi:MAG: hypothetical protein JRI72_16090 [Deltaproteobacteria bacterium]|nr:hypothetical protein [Deltaproteobacteria bacterium]
MYIWAAIKNRRSIRNFTADPLEELEKIQEKIEQGEYKVMENESQFSLFLNELVLYITSLMGDQN